MDTLLVIPNENLFRVVTDKTTFAEAFVVADQVMYSGIACLVDLIVKEGLINLDLADVSTMLRGMGSAMMGMGEASDEQRAIVAAEEAIVNPLLDNVTLKGAKSLLLSITGGRDLTLWEVDEAASRVRQEVDPDANIIVGATLDEGLDDRIRVSIVASGMPKAAPAEPVRDADLPVWTPRAQREPDPFAIEHFGRRLTEALGGEMEPQRGSRIPQRSRTKERRTAGEDGPRGAPGEVEITSQAQAKLGKPPAARVRKGSGAKKSVEAQQKRSLEDGAEQAEIRRRLRRTPAEGLPAAGWRPAPNGELTHPAPELAPREPEPAPRKPGFFERLGFGRGRRQA